MAADLRKNSNPMPIRENTAPGITNVIGLTGAYGPTAALNAMKPRAPTNVSEPSTLMIARFSGSPNAKPEFFRVILATKRL